MNNTRLISINSEDLSRVIKIPLDKINYFERNYNQNCNDIIISVQGYAFAFTSVEFDIEDIYTKLVDAYEEKA